MGRFCMRLQLARMEGRIRLRIWWTRQGEKKLDEASVELGRVDSLCEKVTGAVTQIYDNPALVDVLLDIKTAVQGLCKVQSVMRLPSFHPPQDQPPNVVRNILEPTMVSLGNVAKKTKAN
jgi:hypothetical protein